MDFFKLAHNNTITFGDTDILPRSREYDLLGSKLEDVRNIIDGTGFDCCSDQDPNLYVKSKKSGGGDRVATLIDPLVHLRFLALAFDVASQVEGKRVPKEKGMVHSYRFLPDIGSGMIFDRRYGFGSFSRFC